MLYDARIVMRLPGDYPADAVKRLASKLPPGWTFTVETIQPAPEQPAQINGSMTLRLPGVRPNGR